MTSRIKPVDLQMALRGESTSVASDILARRLRPVLATSNACPLLRDERFAKDDEPGGSIVESMGWVEFVDDIAEVDGSKM